MKQAEPEEKRSVAPTGLLAIYDVLESLNQIKREPAWLEGKDRTMILTKSDHMRVVLRALHAGSELSTHKADGQISVQVLDGHIEFTADARTVAVKKGQLLVPAGGALHSVRAVEESAILITLAVDAAR